MRTAPSGHTQVVAVIGDPISHSLSPAIHNAAFEAVGLDWVCVALPVAAGAAGAAVGGIRALGLAGVSVTMPHKQAVIDQLDEVTEVAGALDAVNCIRVRGGRLIGDNTDGAGFLGGLKADFGFEADGRRCVVLGAGGAARAVVLALAGAGASRVVVVNRTEVTAQRAVTLAGPVGRVGSFDDIVDADLVVNATPIGMAGAGGNADDVPLPVELLHDGLVVAELIYHPARTRLIDEAESVGARAANGVSMLVHQAAVSFESWTGVRAPLAAMIAAATGALES
ncbi:MAG: shikimate dehydrogenase [Microthrixaceae bacterium]